LKLEFALDDEQLDVLKEEIIEGQKRAVDENGKVLVWVGASPVPCSECSPISSPEFLSPRVRVAAEHGVVL
jgi:hypothetical protein